VGVVGGVETKLGGKKGGKGGGELKQKQGKVGFTGQKQKLLEKKN